MAGLNLFTNNAATTLATGINSSVTSLTVASATGSLFPTLAGSQYFYCTLSNTAGTTIEIVKVTARSTDTFTIVRGQDNTTAAAFIAGDKVELRLTAGDLQNFPQLDSTNTFAAVQTFSATPVFSAGITSTATPVGITSGGTGAASLAAATIATQGYTTTATAAGTTTLTVSSTQLQFFTGTTTQTVVLPVASTLTAGQRFEIHNNSTGSVTVNSSGANLVATVLPNTTTVLTCILTSGTSAASWDADIQGFTTTLPVTQGGTGSASATAYAVQCGGTTSTGAHQSIASVGTSGQVLTSNGAGALPTFQAAAGGFASGTRMSFQQTAAPTGWTKDTTAAINDSILRFVTGSASSGGTTAFSTWNAQTASGATTLSTAQIPSHSHNLGYGSIEGGQFSPGIGASAGATTSLTNTYVAGGGGSHTHSLTQSLKYYDFIIASKD